MLSSFFNDVVIVSTVAIVIGQHARSDLKDSKFHEKEKIEKEYNELSDNLDATVKNKIAKQLENIRAYECLDLAVFHYIFYFIIIAALATNLVHCYEEGMDAPPVVTGIIKTCEIGVEAIVLCVLLYYGAGIYQMKRLHKNFQNKCAGFLAGLEFVPRRDSSSASASTPSANATPEK